MSVLLTSCGDSFADSVIPAAALRQIAELDELEVRYEGDSTATGIDARDRRKIATIQAEQWNTQPILVMVREMVYRRYMSDGDRKDRLVWLYVYRNDAGSVWLGVTVGSNGIIDAATGVFTSDRVAQCPAIEGWRLEPSDLDHSDIPGLGVPRLYTLKADRHGSALWIGLFPSLMPAPPGLTGQYYDRMYFDAQSRSPREISPLEVDRASCQVHSDVYKYVTILRP